MLIRKMKELNIKNKLAASIKQNMKDRLIVTTTTDSENEIGRDNTPDNCPDEFFEVANESPKFHLNTPGTQDEFFSTKGDESELNVTKIAQSPNKIFS
jgi:hypothetical protein